jgi:polar amino acid transport system substrate-binding protein
MWLAITFANQNQKTKYFRRIIVKKTIFFVIFLSLVLLQTFSLHAADTVSVVVDSGNPPFMYAKDSKAAGLYPTLLGKIFQRADIQAEFKAYPWKRVLSLGEKGKAGIGGIYKNNERLKIYDYSEPIFSEKLVLYINKEKAFSYNSVEDLKGKKIGVVLGWSYGKEFDEARKNNLFTVEEIPEDLTNFKKLAAGRIDCLIAIELAGQTIIKDENMQNVIVPAETPIAVNDTYLVFSKAAKKKDILDKFNGALAQMKGDGSYEKVIADFIAEKQ